MRRNRVIHVLSAVVLAGPALVAVGTSGAAAPAAVEVSSRPPSAQTALPGLSKVSIGFGKRAGGLKSPTQVVSANDGSPRLFITERSGLVRVYLGDRKLQSRPYLDLRSRVRGEGEQGLLGIAFRKDFPKTHQFWVAYTANDGSFQLSRFTATSEKATRVSAASERKVLNIPHPTYTNHHGGSLAFGKDGLLYIGTGDGGGSGDPRNNAQSRVRLLGKILRLDVHKSCSGKRYCNPRTNPYYGSKYGRDEIWAIGLRNPWRISIDAKNGDLWIGDVGQNRYEEIDRVPAGSAGWNLGWPCREGRAVFEASRCSSTARLRAPVETYGHSLGRSVTGGIVYRGSKYAGLIAGRYVYADFVSGRVWLRASSGATRVVAKRPQLTSFGVSDRGEIYAVSFDGNLYGMNVKRR